MPYILLVATTLCIAACTTHPATIADTPEYAVADVVAMLPKVDNTSTSLMCNLRVQFGVSEHSLLDVHVAANVDDDPIVIVRDSFDRTPVLILSPGFQMGYDVTSSRVVISEFEHVVFLIGADGEALTLNFGVGMKKQSPSLAIDARTLIADIPDNRVVTITSATQIRVLGRTEKGGRIEATIASDADHQLTDFRLFRGDGADPIFEINKLAIDLEGDVASQVPIPREELRAMQWARFNEVGDYGEATVSFAGAAMAVAVRSAIREPETRSEFLTSLGRPDAVVDWDGLAARDRDIAAALRQACPE